MTDGTSPMDLSMNGNSQQSEDLMKLKEAIKSKLLIVYNQMIKGCGREFCTNKYCASCPHSHVFGSSQEAGQMALKLIQEKSAELCSQTPLPPPSLGRKFVEEVTNEFSVPTATLSKTQETLLTRMQTVFTDMTSFGISFRGSSEITKEFLVITPDFDFEAIDALVTLCQRNEFFHRQVLLALQELAEKKWTKGLEGKNELETALNVRRFALMLEFPGFYQYKEFSATFHRLLYKALNPNPVVIETFIRWLTEFYSKEKLLKLVRLFHDELAMHINTPKRDEAAMLRLCNIMDMLYNSNRKKRRVNYKEFYNDTVNNDFEYKKREIRKWYSNKRNGTNHFTVYDYAWMLNPESKYLMLSIESDMHQEDARGFSSSEDFFSLLLQGHNALLPYCVIEVRRDNLIEDALNVLSNSHLNFKKRLKVKFVGEQGVDAGGVIKEFFQLIIRQIFDPAYSMFNYNEETRTYWFNPDTFEPRIKFELIGFIIGLALYNTVILDIHFPRVVYKKLLGMEWTFDDLVDFSPSIAKSLEFIMNYEGEDLHELLACTFSVDVESYGKHTVVELVPGGSSILVTQENKHEYVQKYMEWLFEKSVGTLFDAFRKGFYKLYSGEFTTSCDPEELQLLICGSPVLDFHELEKVTRYEGGYNKNSAAIKNFWSVVHEFDLEQKKKFLFFATGSDRAPVGGLGTMPFIIMKHGKDSDQLPSAHTCFNHLLLPAYKSKEKLREKLLIAISNAEGFGLF